MVRNTHFVERMQARLDDEQANDVNISKAQRRDAHRYAYRDTVRGSKSSHSGCLCDGEYSYQQIGKYFGMHFTTVGRIVRATRTFRGNRPAQLRGASGLDLTPSLRDPKLGHLEALVEETDISSSDLTPRPARPHYARSSGELSPRGTIAGSIFTIRCTDILLLRRPVYDGTAVV